MYNTSIIGRARRSKSTETYHQEAVAGCSTYTTTPTRRSIQVNVANEFAIVGAGYTPRIS